MTRVYDFSGSRKTIAATTAQTLIFNGSEIESQGVVAYHLLFDGAGNILSDVDAIRVKANGQTIIDVSEDELRAFYSRFAGFDLAASATRFTIPFYSLEAPNEALADVSQFPVGAEATIEVDMNTGSAAGGLKCAWTKSDVAPQMYPSLIAQQMGIGASAQNERFSFSTTGILQGFGIANDGTTEIGRLKLVLSGIQVLHAPGTEYIAAGVHTDGLAELQAYTGREDVTNPLFIKLNTGIAAAYGSSYFELTTGASWAATKRVVLYQLHPNG